MKPIDQIRNNFFYLNQEEYDCGGNLTIDWSTTGTSRPIFGMFCITFSLIIIPIYISVARIMWRLRDSPCYKIMFACAVNDCVNIVFSSTVFGFLLINGEMYCKHPLFHAVYSIAATFCYVQSGQLCIVLATNRFIEYTSKKLFAVFFQGKQSWYLLLLTVPFPAFVALCTPVFVFNSEMHLLVLNPGIYFDKFQYENVFHVANNTVVPCFPLFLYAFILADVVRTYRKISSTIETTNRAALMLSVQSGFVVLVHFNACITYEVTQYIPPTEAVLYWAHIGWMLIHGLPPFIYIAFNQAIRKGVLGRILPSATSTIAQSGVSLSLY